jgi:hypothetical protein
VGSVWALMRVALARSRAVEAPIMLVNIADREWRRGGIGRRLG